MRIFVITSVRQFAIDLILEDPHNSIVFTTDPNLYSGVVDLVSCAHLLGAIKHYGIRERDRKLFEDFMPGRMKGIDVPGSAFPAWRSLAIDRFKMWYSPGAHDVVEFINSTVSPEQLFVSVDLGSVYPVAVAMKARQSQVIGLATETLMTREFVDLSEFLPFSHYIVDHKEEEQFLNRVLPEKTVENVTEDGAIEYPSRTGIDKISPKNPGVAGIFFDARDEWQLRRFVSETNFGENGYPAVNVFPVSNRAKDLLISSFPNLIGHLRNPKFIKDCDIVFSFRWDSNYCRSLPVPLTIIDYAGLNMAKTIAPEQIKVITK